MYLTLSLLSSSQYWIFYLSSLRLDFYYKLFFNAKLANEIRFCQFTMYLAMFPLKTDGPLCKCKSSAVLVYYRTMEIMCGNLHKI